MELVIEHVYIPPIKFYTINGWKPPALYILFLVFIYLHKHKPLIYIDLYHDPM